MTAPSASHSHRVVIGASAGGVGALLQLAGALQRDFPAPICVVQHVGTNPSFLPSLLSSRGRLHAEHANPTATATDNPRPEAG